MQTYTLIFLLICLVSSIHVWAYDFETDGFYFNITGPGSVEVTFSTYMAKDYNGDVKIPAVVCHNGASYSVTGIGDYAFRACEINSIVIPASVINIGTGAFFGCNSLISFTVENGNPAFSSTDGVLYKEVNTLYLYPVARNGNSFDIPKGITEIASFAFSGCSSLSSISIPNTVTSIGINAFASCKLTAITIPASVTNIGTEVFSNCNRLQTINVETE